MEFRHLKTFRTVADYLSFTKAARELGMAQSSISAQIRALEQELNLVLFDRVGRRVVITEEGSKLYQYARRIEEMTVELRSELAGNAMAQGSLTIRVPDTLAAVYMPEVVARFHTAYPHVQLNLINCTDLQLREELNSGRIDLAFLMTDAIHMREVNVQVLKTEKLNLMTSPAHLLATHKKLRPADLAGNTLLLPKTD